MGRTGSPPAVLSLPHSAGECREGVGVKGQGGVGIRGRDQILQTQPSNEKQMPSLSAVGGITNILKR